MYGRSTAARSQATAEILKRSLRERLALLFVRRRLEDAFDLLEVIDVVARHHVQDALDGFFAALGVHAVMFPLLGLQTLEHSEIGFAHRAKNFQALARTAFVVPSGGDPRILVVGLNRSSRRSEN